MNSTTVNPITHSFYILAKLLLLANYLALVFV